ncbi:MAG: ATP-binding cassette domain-containing protein [Propionibacteriaceae bacterium]|nr:ATP-binding cassette domain-containing protein [Propionibacteriaceae bacterium]
MNGPDTALIDVAGLSKAIPGGGMALRDASLRIFPGTFTAIVGTSGSGKTTLLSLLGLLDHPTGGQYLFDGVDVAGLDETAHDDLRGQRIGFVFQNSYLMADQTVAENVALPLQVRGVPTDVGDRLVGEALTRVGLDGFQTKRAGELSGGEKQRVAVARAMVGQPDVVLADEPTGALDTVSSQNLVELLRRIADNGTAVVVVTHDPLVAQAADRRIELTDGVTENGLAPPKGRTPSRPSSSMGLSPELDAMLAKLGLAPKPAAAQPVVTQPDAPSEPKARPGGVKTVRWSQELAAAVLAPLGRPLRSGLVLLAYLLGIAALVGAIGLTQSATGQIVTRLTDAASNQIQVTVNDPNDPFITDATRPDGAAARAAKLDGVTLATPVRSYSGQSNPMSRLPGATQTSFGGSIYIVQAAYIASYGYQTAQGDPSLLTNPWSGATAVLGPTAAQDLNVAQVGPGVQIWIGSHPVDVIAILKPTGDTLVDDTVFFSPAVDPYLTNIVESYLLVRTGKGYAEPLAKALPLALAPQNPGSIHVSTTSQLANLQAGINTDLTNLLAILAAVILILSALTAGTTMFLSVQHRAPEIALRRAMGASRASIWRIFTYEGTAIGLAGGALGAVVGTVLVWAVAHHNQWTVCIGTQTVILGLAAGLAAGAIASTIPAIYAARRDPAQILRTV